MARATRHRGKETPSRAVPLLLVVAVTTVVLLVVASHRRRGRDDVRLARAGDRLAECLLGDVPLVVSGAREELEARARLAVRGLQLTAMGLSPERRLAGPNLPWPARCAHQARWLAEEERQRRDESADPLARLAVALEADGSTTVDWTPALVAWLRVARESGERAASDEPPPPVPARADNIDTLDRKARVLGAHDPPTRLHFAPFFDDFTDLVVEELPEASGPALCTYDEARMRCLPLLGDRGAHVAPALRLRGTRDRSAPATFEPSENPSPPDQLFWGFVVSRRVIRGSSAYHLFVRDSHQEASAEVDVGEAGESANGEADAEPGRLRGCRAGDTIAVAAQGWDVEYLTFHRQGSWTRPVSLAHPGSVMICHKGEAVFLDARGHVEGGAYQPVITRTSCTPELCRTVSAQTRDVFAGNADVLPREARDLRAAPVGDSVLVLWRAGVMGGLRMRVAKLSELSKVEDTVLFDDHIEGGALVPNQSTLLDFDLAPVSDGGVGGALVVLSTTAGTFLYHVDRSGRRMSLPLERERE